MRNATLTSCVAWAFGVAEYQVEGPAWLSETRFDIVAKAGSAAGQPELRQMLQKLLADRFHLAHHRQMREIQALVLTVSKNGHKLKAVEKEGSPSFKTGKLNLTGQGATLSQMTEFLAKQLKNPIVDQTGLTGRFDYFLDINPYFTEDMQRNGPGGGPPPDAAGIVAQAMSTQLGLKMDSKKAPVEMVVVDSMAKEPTEN